jgi:MFS family permease
MTTITQSKDRIAGRKTYLIFLIVLMGLVAIMDQYLSTIKSSALPFLLEEYGIEAAEFSYLEAVFLAATFLVFLLNGLNDIIGRKYAILILVLIMGLSSRHRVVYPSIACCDLLYLLIFTTVSNMSRPIGEEAPAPEQPASQWCL